MGCFSIPLQRRHSAPRRLGLRLINKKCIDRKTALVAVALHGERCESGIFGQRQGKAAIFVKRISYTRQFDVLNVIKSSTF